MLQDMAVARSCLTLWLYRILVRMYFDPQKTKIRHRSVRGAGRLDWGWCR